MKNTTKLSVLSFIALFSMSIATVSCTKNCDPLMTVPPGMDSLVNKTMIHKNLQDTEVKFQQRTFAIDLDSNGTKDLIFGVMLVGDAVNKQDKYMFMVTSGIDTRLPVNANEQVPVLQKGDKIPVDNIPAYNWYELSSVMLMQKVVTVNMGNYWEGNWKSASRKYLPFQHKLNGKKYNGWVEMTLNPNQEKAIIHSYAICKSPEKDIYIGK